MLVEYRGIDALHRLVFLKRKGFRLFNIFGRAVCELRFDGSDDLRFHRFGLRRIKLCFDFRGLACLDGRLRLFLRYPLRFLNLCVKFRLEFRGLVRGLCLVLLNLRQFVFRLYHRVNRIVSGLPRIFIHWVCIRGFHRRIGSLGSGLQFHIRIFDLFCEYCRFFLRGFNGLHFGGNIKPGQDFIFDNLDLLIFSPFLRVLDNVRLVHVPCKRLRLFFHHFRGRVQAVHVRFSHDHGLGILRHGLKFHRDLLRQLVPAGQEVVDVHKPFLPPALEREGRIIGREFSFCGFRSIHFRLEFALFRHKAVDGRYKGVLDFLVGLRALRFKGVRKQIEFRKRSDALCPCDGVLLLKALGHALKGTHHAELLRRGLETLKNVKQAGVLHAQNAGSHFLDDGGVDAERFHRLRFIRFDFGCVALCGVIAVQYLRRTDDNGGFCAF